MRSMLQKRMKQNERPKSSLGSVRVEDFYGDRGKYQSWKRVVCAQKQLYQLAGSELAMLVYISCKKEARDVLDQMTIEEMVAAGGLERMWALLDEAYHETSEEHFERLEAEFNNYRRTPGQSIPSYLSQIKRLKMEYSREDPLTKMSDRAWAQRILVRAALTKRERMDVFFSAGGCYSPKEIEKALRHRCQKIHEEERRLPQPTRRPFRSSASRASSGTSSTTRSSSTSWRTRSKGGQGSYMVVLFLSLQPPCQLLLFILAHIWQCFQSFSRSRRVIGVSSNDFRTLMPLMSSTATTSTNSTSHHLGSWRCRRTSWFFHMGKVSITF